jgi:NAD(P)-dependent dehydrogenase (short-subunit alcohol dehydrogenase family)
VAWAGTEVLAGKLALVTGGPRGIGRAIVERQAGDGAAVVFSFVRNQPAAEEAVAAVEAAGGNAHAVRADLGRLAEVRRLFDQAERHLGELDACPGSGRPRKSRAGKCQAASGLAGSGGALQ